MTAFTDVVDDEVVLRDGIMDTYECGPLRGKGSHRAAMHDLLCAAEVHGRTLVFSRTESRAFALVMLSTGSHGVLMCWREASPYCWTADSQWRQDIRFLKSACSGAW